MRATTVLRSFGKVREHGGKTCCSYGMHLEAERKKKVHATRNFGTRWEETGKGGRGQEKLAEVSAAEVEAMVREVHRKGLEPEETHTG